MSYSYGFSEYSLLKYKANTKIICDEFIFLEIGQYSLSKRNNAGPQIKKINKLIIFTITPFFGGTPMIYLVVIKIYQIYNPTIKILLKL